MRKYKAIMLLGCCGLLAVFLYYYINKDSQIKVIGGEIKDKEQLISEVPETYKKDLPDSCLSFDAEVIVPEGFDGDNLYLGTAEKSFDRDKIGAVFFGDKTDIVRDICDVINVWGEKVTEETIEDKNGNYIIIDNDYLCFTKSPEMDYIDNCVRADTISPYNNLDSLNATNDLDFMGKIQAKEKVESVLENMGISAKGNQYHIFALDVKTLQEQEMAMDMQGNEVAEEKNPEWTKDQEGYYFFGEQTFQGLPVWSKLSVEDAGYFEDMAEMPIQIFYSGKGIIYCCLNNYCEIKKGNEKVTLAPFEKIITTIEEKYQDLDANSLIVRKMKLMEFPMHQKDGTYQMVPMWICFMDVIMSDGERETLYKQMPINAITGEEEISIEGDRM